MSEDTFWDDLTKPSPVEPGTRIRLLAMPDDPDPIPIGTCGTVKEGSNGAQIKVEWDIPRSLSLAVGVDEYEVLEERG